jgi:hypothetical protein
MAWGNTPRAWEKTETFLALHQLFTGSAPLVGCGNRTDEKRQTGQSEQHNQPSEDFHPGPVESKWLSINTLRLDLQLPASEAVGGRGQTGDDQEKRQLDSMYSQERVQV